MKQNISEVYNWGVEFSKYSPRIPGTDNIEKARDFILKQLQSSGLEAWLEPINFRGVFYQEWQFKVDSPEIPPMISSPQNNVGFGTVDAEIIDIGCGTYSDYKGKNVKGKIVLINWGTLMDHEGPCGRGKRYPLLASYDAAWTRGVAGMVGYFEDTPGNSLKILEPGIKTTGGSNVTGPSEIGEDKQFKLPVLHIGRKDALALKKILVKKPLTGHLSIKGKRKVSTVWNVIGKLPGRKKSKDNIIVGAHYCSTFEGAICDTVGVVGALELARQFSKIPQRNRLKTMYFVFSGSHVWINCNISSLRFIAKHNDMMPRVSAMLWMDHISSPVYIGAKRVSRREFPTRIGLTSDNLILTFLTFISMLKNKRMPLALPISRIWTLCEMGPFDNIGVPCMGMQVSSHLMLTSEDTWDKIDPVQLYLDISVYLDLARYIQRVPGRLLRLFESPGRSFFGCGTLFKDPKVPKYPPTDTYRPEKAHPLIISGKVKPLEIVKR